MARITRIVDDTPPAFYTPGELARLLKVDPKTVSRWARAGKLRCIKTLGGHRRFIREDVEAFLTARDAR